jgi:hypothetical protein
MGSRSSGASALNAGVQGRLKAVMFFLTIVFFAVRSSAGIFKIEKE